MLECLKMLIYKGCLPYCRTTIIHLLLYFSGRPNCPSGFDESEEQCGKYRLIELPGGIFAIFGCIAAALSACLIFCILGLVRKRKKPIDSKNHTINGGGTLQKNHYKKEQFFFDPDSWHGLQPVEYIHVDRETTVWQNKGCFQIVFVDC